MYFRFIILLEIFLLIFVTTLSTKAETNSFTLCPLCTKDGKLVCPNGFEVACANETEGDTEPKCILFGLKYTPGCWKFVGMRKMDINFGNLNLPPSYKVEIIGGGETYTLNREIIGCRKL